MCTVILLLQMTSALFAASAAICWYLVARIKTPPEITAIVLTDEGFTGELQELFHGLAEQGKWNKRAAICAVVAAIAQAVLVKMPTCIALS